MAGLHADRQRWALNPKNVISPKKIIQKGHIHIVNLKAQSSPSLRPTREPLGAQNWDQNEEFIDMGQRRGGNAAGRVGVSLAAHPRATWFHREMRKNKGPRWTKETAPHMDHAARPPPLFRRPVCAASLFFFHPLSYLSPWECADSTLRLIDSLG